MIVAEFFKLCVNLAKFMSENDLKCSDYKYMPLYEEYVSMRENGNKVDYILYVLSDKYKLSESTIKRIVRRFSKEVKS